MLKKFYIVKDYKDLTSGQVIPQKVLDYLPASLYNPFLRQPSIQTMPIKKSQGIVIPVGSPSYGELTPLSLSSASIIPAGPSATVQVSRRPLFPSGCNTCAMYPSSTGCSTCGTYASASGTVLQYGPPIIKASPMIAQNVPGLIKIISGNHIFTINVPIRYMRNVVNDIYFNANEKLDPTVTKVTFRIITPTIDSSISTTYDRMVQILDAISNKYTGLMYKANNGQEISLGNFIIKLKRNVGSDGKYIPVDVGQLNLP